jgi:hypothetical protein
MVGVTGSIPVAPTIIAELFSETAEAIDPRAVVGAAGIRHSLYGNTCRFQDSETGAIIIVVTRGPADRYD